MVIALWIIGFLFVVAVILAICGYLSDRHSHADDWSGALAVLFFGAWALIFGFVWIVLAIIHWWGR